MPENQSSTIRNIIFDLGGVLLNINPLLSLNAFSEMNGIAPEELHKRLASEKIFEKFDTGSLSPDEFRSDLCRIMGKKTSDDEIDHAWNLLLLDFPAERVKLLQKLRKNYRIYLLSNTNIIHYRHYTKEFFDTHGVEMPELFDKLFLSYEIGMHKPDTGIYSFVLEKEGLNAAECLFIDDSLLNTEAAGRSGIHTINITEAHDVTYYFENGIIR